MEFKLRARRRLCPAAERRRRRFDGGLAEDGLGRWAVEPILRVNCETVVVGRGMGADEVAQRGGCPRRGLLRLLGAPTRHANGLRAEVKKTLPIPVAHAAKALGVMVASAPRGTAPHPRAYPQRKGEQQQKKFY